MFEKIRAFRLRLLRNIYTWISIFFVACVIAITISAWPAAQCALGQCDTPDQWCNGDCSQACQPATRLGYVESCQAIDADGDGRDDYCDDTWNPNRVPAQCASGSNCNITSVSSNGSRFRTSGGYSYWNVGRCPSISSSPSCTVQNRWSREDCCTAGSGGGGGGGGSCTPTYQPPTVTLAGHTPPYPLVIGQDPDEVGFDATVTAVGGTKSNSCDRGDDQQELTSLALESLALSDASRAWITGELAQFYPGAKVKDYYPQWPDNTVNLNGVNGSLIFHHDPLDPGLYDVVVVATQADGQQTRVTLQIPTYLLEATIVR